MTVSPHKSITCNITVDHKMKSSDTRQWRNTPPIQLKDKYSSPDRRLPGEDHCRSDALDTFSSVTTVTTGLANMLLIQKCWWMSWKHYSRVFFQMCSQPIQWFNARCHEVGHMPVLLPEVKWVTAAGAAAAGAAAAAAGESGRIDKTWAVSKDPMSQSVLWMEKGGKRRRGWRDLREVISPCIKAPV